MSEISKVYNQFEESLGKSQSEYFHRLKQYSDMLAKVYNDHLHEYIYDFSKDFENQIERLAIKATAEQFFGSVEIPFVAIDGSCFKHASSGFISLYGGAYGAKGMASLSGMEGKVRYEKWELAKDVSMVAFVPIPPDCTDTSIAGADSDNETPTYLSDSEIGRITFLHTKIMQLAEVYLAWSLANASSVDYPRLIMLDNSISGILANSSFSPKNVRMGSGDFQGETIDIVDMQIALAHPFEQKLGVPSTKMFQPHHRVIAEAVWAEKRTIKASECPDLPEKNFEKGARYLEAIGGGKYNSVVNEFIFTTDPRRSWQKCVNVFSYVCERMFREKCPDGLMYRLRDDPERHAHFLPKDISFLIGIGVRSLIETCWRKHILLTGIVKDSNSRFFYRNYLGSDIVNKEKDPVGHLRVPLSDRGVMEILPNIDTTISAPWSTLDFDSAFMTLHPEFDEQSHTWVIKGYNHPQLGETTRPERIVLRSIAQFFISPDRNIASHALFLDRLAYPDWDDIDSEDMIIGTEFFGKVVPLSFNIEDGVPRLQKLNMFLMSILIRNHYPQALGYPDPLHQADWGALSMERRVRGLLTSSEWAFRSHPLSKTFREIRDSRR